MQRTLNILISLSEERWLYKNWIKETAIQSLTKTSLWVFSASAKICSTNQKRKGTKDIRQTEINWLEKLLKGNFDFDYQWNMIQSNMRITRVSCLAALTQPSLFYVWWARFQSAFPPPGVASVSPAWNVNIWAKYFLIFSLLCWISPR